ncbi:hypothetical protein ACLKA7_002843 [Drosophila subpalustris]
MPNTFVTFEDFMSMPLFFWHTLGVDPYKTVTERSESRWLDVKLVMQLVNLNFGFGTVLTFLYVCYKNSEHFAEACMVVAFIGFIIVGEIKILTVWKKRNQLDALMREMEPLFPSATAKDQEQYQADLYLRRSRKVMKFLTYLFLLLVAIYNLYDIAQFILQRYILQLPDVKMSLPYCQYASWSLDTKLGFCAMYAIQAIAGYTCTMGQLASDILIYGVVMQDIMHFDNLSRTLRELSSTQEDATKNLRTMQQLIIYHNKLLGQVFLYQMCYRNLFHLNFTSI